MGTAKTILDIVGYISTGLVLISLITGTILWFKGILPVLLRLGNGLAKRKIAIFAKGDNLGSIKSLVLDSKLFREKNIIEIANKNDLGKADEASAYLMYWHDWADDIADILSKKPDSCPLVVYAPYDKARIPDDQMKNLDGKRNTAVTNFRGRLLNDIVTAMITTGYEEKS